MSELKLFVQRRRRVLARLGALFAIVVGGGVAVALPKADANEHIQPHKPDMADLLLSPARLSSERFMAYYALAYR